MNFVETIREERNERTVPLSQFYSEYKKSSNICYGFVEGKDDPSYYRHVINSKLPCNCSIVLYPSMVRKMYITFIMKFKKGIINILK